MPAAKPKPKPGEFHIGDGSHLVVKSSTTIQMYDYLRVVKSENTNIVLPIEIKADFEKIPPEYHQLFMQMMTVRYGGIVNIWDNKQPFAKPDTKKKRWWEFWKR